MQIIHFYLLSFLRPDNCKNLFSLSDTVNRISSSKPKTTCRYFRLFFSRNICAGQILSCRKTCRQYAITRIKYNTLYTLYQQFLIFIRIIYKHQANKLAFAKFYKCFTELDPLSRTVCSRKLSLRM